MWCWRPRAEWAFSSRSIGSTFPCSRGLPAPRTTSSPIWRRAETHERIKTWNDALLRSLDDRPLQSRGRSFHSIAQERGRERRRRCALGPVLALVPLVLRKTACTAARGGRDPTREEFAAGLGRVVDASERQRVCLLCAEREPLDCHRCLLVGRALVERGLAVGHIRADGTIETHAATEERLLAISGADLFRDRAQNLAHAYRRRARAIAARLKD